MSPHLTYKLMAKLYPRRLNAVLSRISRSVPFLSCYYQYNQLRLCARWPSSLPGQVLPSSNTHALSYKSAQTYFSTGQYSPNFVSYITTQSGHGGEPPMSTRESYHNTTVCRSTQIRRRTYVKQLVLRDDWNPSQSESSCPLPKPWLLHT